MKKYLLILVCAFAWIGANAQQIGNYVSIVDGVTVVTTTSTGQLNNLSDNEKTALQGATSLKLVGYFSEDPDFLKLRDCGCKPVNVDLTGAHIAQGTVTYTYYYLDEDNHNVRYKLSQDNNGWYYTNNNGQRVGVNDADVRIYSASVSGGLKMPDGWKESLVTLSLPTDPNYNVLGADFCNGFKKLTTVTIPDNVTVISDKAFYETTALVNVTLPSNLIAICKWAFYKSALTSFSIPGSVEIVEYMALTECEQITTLVFEESAEDHHMLVKEYGIFNLANLQDIYINTTAMVDCENNAFDFRITWGQGDTTRDMCTLHFKPEVAAHYANLSHPLTPAIAKDAARFHNWLIDHYKQAGQAKGNGWWEFISNGTIEEEEDGVKGTKFLRTYSDYNYDRIVPAGVKAYIVTGLTKNTDNEYCLNLRQLFVIPKRTGVILYGVSNSKDENNNDILSMSLCEIANGTPLRRDYWYQLQGTDATTMKNYLWPTCVTFDPDPEDPEGCFVEEPYVEYTLDANGNVVKDEDGDYQLEYKTRKVLKEATSASSVEPYKQKTGFVTPNGAMTGYDATVLNGFYRNFYMSRYKTTNSGKKYGQNGGDLTNNDFVGFFRAKKSTIKPGMAYLLLKSNEYEDAEGGEVVINPDTESPFVYQNQTYNMKSYQVEYNKNNGTPQLPSQSGYWIEGTDVNPAMQWDLVANWGDRSRATAPNQPNGAKFVAVDFSGEPEIIENEDGTATMILPSNMIEDVETGDYYTLQGVRVTKPTKGVYIKNGKKVVIK
jgi:hypothetical protein